MIFRQTMLIQTICIFERRRAVIGSPPSGRWSTHAETQVLLATKILHENLKIYLIIIQTINIYNFSGSLNRAGVLGARERAGYEGVCEPDTQSVRLLIQMHFNRMIFGIYASYYE